METVVVLNNSGMTLQIFGKRVRPLREFVGDQSFDFETPEKAIQFEQYLNQHEHKGLTAIYAGTEAVEEKELTVLIAQSEELKALDVKQLKAKCKDMKLTGYSSLKEADLIALIIANTKAE